MGEAAQIANNSRGRAQLAIPDKTCKQFIPLFSDQARPYLSQQEMAKLLLPPKQMSTSIFRILWLGRKNPFYVQSINSARVCFVAGLVNSYLSCSMADSISLFHFLASVFDLKDLSKYCPPFIRMRTR